MHKGWTRKDINHDTIIESKTREQIIDISFANMGNLDENIFWEDFAVSELLHSSLGCEHDIFVFIGELIEHWKTKKKVNV